MFKRWLLVLIFIFSFELLIRVLFLQFYPDFSVYYISAKKSLLNLNPYIQNSSQFAPFVYPPTTLFIFLPLALLPFNLSQYIWAILSLSALLLSLFISFKIFSLKFKSNLSLIISSLVFLSFPLKFTLGMGQINTIILLLITLFIFFYKKKKYIAGGIFLGLSILIKFFPLLFLPYLFFRKKWTLLLSCLVTILTLSILSTISFGFPIHIYFIQKIFPLFTRSWEGGYYNQSLSMTLARIVGDVFARGIIYYICVFICLLIVAFVIYRRHKRDLFTDMLEFGILITSALLLDVVSWQHHFIWLYLPFIATLFSLNKQKVKSIFYILLFGSYILTTLNLKQPLYYNQFIQSHVFFGTVVLWCLDIWLLYKY